MTGTRSPQMQAENRPAGASTRPQTASYESTSSGANPRGEWDHPEQEDDEATCVRARNLLRRARSPHHSIGDLFDRWRHEVFGRPWLRRTLVGSALAFVLGTVCFGLLWWRLGAGPISVDMVTPWLAQAIEENFGNQHRVQVGGTQIERAEDGHIAVRIRDITVRDRSNVVVASAPKAEVRLSGASLLSGRLRAESLNLVGAELSVRLAADGRVTVSAGANARPIATAAPTTGPSAASNAAPATSAQQTSVEGFAAALAWIDGLSASGLDGYELNEIGLKSGTLTVDDQQSGNKWTFENITLSLRRPRGGGVVLQVGEESPDNPWMLRAAVGPPRDGVRSLDIAANKVSTKNMLLAARLSDMSYTADLPVSAVIRGEIGRDGFPTFLSGKVAVGAGEILDKKVPNYPMTIDSAELSIDWDANRRTMVAPFRLVSGANRITSLMHIEPPNDQVPHWQVGLSGGTFLLRASESEPPVIFNRVGVRVRFDTAAKKILIERADIGNSETGIAGSATIDYSLDEPRLALGFAGTPMSMYTLKRVWPITVAPEVREWVLNHIDGGTVQKVEIGVNAPLNTLARGGPPIPDEGLSVDITAINASVQPVKELPPIKNADVRARVTGRTATVTVGQGSIETPAGRKLALSDFVFEVPDMVPNPPPARGRFRIDGAVPAAAEILASDRLSEFSGSPVDPNASRGTISAQVQIALPLKPDLGRGETTYALNVDLTNFSAEKMVMNQRLEANAVKIVANNQGFQVRGDVRINGMPANLDYRKPRGDADAEVKLQATLDEAARNKLGIDLGSGVTGAIPVKMTGKIAANGDQRLGIEADLTPVKIENALPGWVKPQGRAGRATFNLVQKAQTPGGPTTTRFEDLVIEGGGAQIKGTVELDQNNDLLSANFPNYGASEGDKVSLRVDRAPDGTLKVVVRGDVFDGRSFIKSAMAGSSKDTKAKTDPTNNMDLEVKLGAVAGFHGEAMRNLDVKLARRGGVVRSFALGGRIGRDTPIVGDMRGRAGGRDVVYLETNDAGAFFRLTDTYAKMFGGQMWVAMDPPGNDSAPREGLLNVRDFAIRGETALDNVVGGGAGAAGVQFSRMRVEFTREPGQMTVRDGVVQGPAVGATIDGQIDYASNALRMRGTFVPLYGLNNMFGQIPIVGTILGGGSNEGLVGVTFEVVGSPGQPVLRVNPISAVAPGLFRKLFEFPGRTTGSDAYAAPQR